MAQTPFPPIPTRIPRRAKPCFQQTTRVFSNNGTEYSYQLNWEHLQSARLSVSLPSNSTSSSSMPSMSIELSLGQSILHSSPHPALRMVIFSIIGIVFSWIVTSSISLQSASQTPTFPLLSITIVCKLAIFAVMQNRFKFTSTNDKIPLSLSLLLITQLVNLSSR